MFAFIVFDSGVSVLSQVPGWVAGKNVSEITYFMLGGT